MARKREQRLRRKVRAQLRALERALAQAGRLRDIALAAIAYIHEIDAPNIKEPYAIYNRRERLACLVHAHKPRHVERRSVRAA